MSKPLVSVIMACYNAGECVQQAIDSILRQSYCNFEFIIIDDGSSDNTFHILNKNKTLDDRITIWRNEKNLGLSASLNKAIALCNGTLIARMDADDEAVLDRLQKQVNFMNEHVEVDILGTSVFTRDQVGAERGPVIQMPTEHDQIINRIFRKTLVLHPTIMLRSKVYKDLGQYDPSIRWAEDADLWYRIYDQVKWANLAEPLLIYTVKKRLNGKIVINNLRVKYRNLKKRGITLKYAHILIFDLIHLTKRMIISR